MLRRHRPLTSQRHGDRGSVSVWLVIFSFAFMLLLALVVDGGQLMNAKERAADIAEQAARATVNDIDIAALRGANGGHISISAAACAAGGPAVSLVAAYARGTGVTAGIPPTYHGRPGCRTGTVRTPAGVQHFATVTVEITTRPVLPFGVFGSYQVPATQTAFLECGVDQGVAC
jgi:uncharacterized membrane protein